MLPCNIIVTVVFWTLLGGASGFVGVTTHAVPMFANTVEWLFTRMVYEANLSWTPTIYVAMYGFCILLPYTLDNGPVYGILSFDSVTSWLLAFGMVAMAPLSYFIAYGLQEVKFRYIYQDYDKEYEAAQIAKAKE